MIVLNYSFTISRLFIPLFARLEASREEVFQRHHSHATPIALYVSVSVMKGSPTVTFATPQVFWSSHSYC